MRSRAHGYNAAVLDALSALRSGNQTGFAVQEGRLAALRVGMIFALDVKVSGGVLLVARGCEITESLLERIRNFRPGAVGEPLRVIVRNTVSKAA